MTDFDLIEKTRKSSICRMGAISAFIAGFCYICIVLCAFAAPASIASYITSDQYFIDFKSYEPIFIFLKGMMVIANSAFVGVVIAYISLVRPYNYGKMIFFSALAIIGLGIGIFQSVLDMTIVPRLAYEYSIGNASVRDSIVAFGVANPAIYIASLGFPGIWFIVVSLMALDNPEIPKLLVLLGLLWGVGNIVTVIAHLLVIIWLIYFVAFGALCAAPVWSIWEGLYLWKVARSVNSK